MIPDDPGPSDEHFQERARPAPNGQPVARAAERPRGEVWRKPSKTPAERALGIGKCGPPLPTEIATLDQATRGGPRAGGLLVVGGAPESGKTALMVQLVRTWAERGVPVTVLACDQDADDLLVRLGQHLGLERAEIERGDPATLQQLSEALQALPNLVVFDADEDQAAIEDAADELITRAGGRQGVLAVDSIQTATAAGVDDSPDRRREVDAIVGALKAAAKRGLLVLVTSEVNRGGYRNRNPDEQVNDLAAFKESGGIEYAMHLGLVLRGRDDGVVDVSMAKNRWGTKRPFRLVIDPRRASMSEVARPLDLPALEVNSETRFEMDMEAGRRVLRENPGIAGKDKLRALLTGMGTTRRSAVVRALEQAGEIEDRGGKGRPRLYLKPRDSNGADVIPLRPPPEDDPE